MNDPYLILAHQRADELRLERRRIAVARLVSNSNKAPSVRHTPLGWVDDLAPRMSTAE